MKDPACVEMRLAYTSCVRSFCSGFVSASAAEDNPQSFGVLISLARLRRCSSQWRVSIFRCTWVADAAPLNQVTAAATASLVCYLFF